MNQPELQLRKNNTDMDVWEHVGELRRRLIRCVAAVALAFAVLVYIGPERVMNAVAAPVKEQGVQLIYLGLADALYVQLKVVFLCAVVLAAPVLLWQMWAFVRPALYPEERKLAIGWAVFSLLLFAAGVAFGYGVVFLSALGFFVYAGAGTAMPLFAIDRYVNFLLGFVIPFGLIFEMPLACTIAAKAGVLRADTLRRGRRFAVLLSFIVSALLTPPDVLSQIMMAVPTILLFECSIYCAGWAERSLAEKRVGSVHF